MLNSFLYLSISLFLPPSPPSLPPSLPLSPSLLPFPPPSSFSRVRWLICTQPSLPAEPMSMQWPELATEAMQTAKTVQVYTPQWSQCSHWSQCSLWSSAPIGASAPIGPSGPFVPVVLVVPLVPVVLVIPLSHWSQWSQWF